MNILYILGNGFDLSLGLKTSYSHFYTHYLSQKSKHPIIVKLKEEIKDVNSNWSDLEIALGKFTTNLTSLEDFDIVNDDIRYSLSNYLKAQEESLVLNNGIIKSITQFFAKPETPLPLTELRRLVKYKNKWSSSQWNVNIVTFNYTQIVEKIFENSNNLKIGNHHNHTIQLRSVNHIHGLVDKDLIMGINDVSQLSNKSFHENIDFLESFIKPIANQALQHA
ncbi:AbiH family protein [Sediminicola luteus]|uniref:Bacteriophage abortive infection AbiH n=1 Tax=Sediminicola luteus TaxID=319238 RepID=A0A2A4G4G9_9FLAO|nr:AbiH family protein [Sediminicola luteus]PCE62870.1 hypothetical protein B7P33_16460 [Sediminicola luteus]